MMAIEMVNGSPMAESADVIPSATMAKFYIKCAVGLCVLTIIAVVSLTMYVENPTAAVATILGITTPMTMGLLAAGLHGVATNVDGKMSQLLQSTAKAEHLEGLVEGLKENPRTNIS